ncbi:MAG: DUF3431 domain-containing protein, partial [Bacteroidota bacterium]
MRKRNKKAPTKSIHEQFPWDLKIKPSDILAERSQVDQPVEIVISAYKENVSALINLIDQIEWDHSPKITVYCKHPDQQYEGCIHVPNYGTEEFAYLLHILRHGYDTNPGTLANVTIFVQANIHNHRENRASRFTKSPFGRILRKSSTKTVRSQWEGFSGFRRKSFNDDFTLQEYRSMIGGGNQMLCMPNATHLGDWFQSIGGSLEHAHCTGVSYLGTMSVRRDRILRHDRSVYQKMLEEVERCSQRSLSDETGGPKNAFLAGHFIERSWRPLFSDENVRGRERCDS